MTGTMAMNQLKLIAEAGRTLRGKRDQPRIKFGDDGVHSAVRRRSPLPLFAKCKNPPMDGSGRRPWLLEEQPFNQLDYFSRDLAAATILAGLPNQPAKPLVRY